ncbi:MAG: twin-arginine translocase TatA/TatE family subunit [Deltaproteobacteria bacterium]|nr:twin-arginine translocase TatA/TatE family subunit [Deltaproteobacteria bacterium]
MGVPAPTELLLILAIVLLVFGSKRIPEIMSGFGQGIKEFKKNLESDDPPKPVEEAGTNQQSSTQENLNVKPTEK